MTVLDDDNAGVALGDIDAALHDMVVGKPAIELAARWGTSVEDGTAHIVRGPSPPWREVRIGAASDGVTELALELPEDSSLPVRVLVAAYGVPEEERALDGPLYLWFRPPGAPGCRIGAAVREPLYDGSATRFLELIGPPA